MRKITRMSQDFDDYRTVSLKLSEVLSDIGVNDRMILNRRRMALLREAMFSNTFRFTGMNETGYNFGSQSEGSTTLGLNSDIDSLCCDNKYNVIQDWGEWQHGKDNLLMIQDETTYPGYCLLQKLRDDEPLPISILDHIITGRHLTVNRDKVMLKNTVFRICAATGATINGPAISEPGAPGIADVDCVQAFHCDTWPVEAQPWLLRQGMGQWPTEDIKRYCETTGCFVVPVSSKNGPYEELEWRISTSHAERCLMFSLNITQSRCYILMKMILKTFIRPQCNGVLSSFMCKTVLFHCIQNTESNHWQQSNLFPCLKCCLTVLQNFVMKGNCPHFIIPENNLMAWKISPHNKQKVSEILTKVIQSEGRALLEIPTDDFGTRLQVKMGGALQYYRTPAQIHAVISAMLLSGAACTVSDSHKLLLREVMHEGNAKARERLSDYVSTLTSMYREMGLNRLEKSALKLLIPFLSSSLGSVIASHDINTTRVISQEAMTRLSVDLNSDVASSRLKLASALYCVGDMERAEFVLRNTREKYDQNTVEAVCMCYPHGLRPRQGFKQRCNTGKEELIPHITAFCVRYLPCEVCCVPKELQYEMFRSTQDEKLERNEVRDCWMDWAVVDSLPYLFFLQYKVYGVLQRMADQQCALQNLVTTIDTESNLTHRETALNILGQCMEQENQHDDALRCYTKSLNIRARNNAAKVHICRLLNILVNK